MNILGISCFQRDAAACLVQDGAVRAAAQEERFDRRKGSSAFPVRAINSCLQSADLTVNDIDGIGFYEKPYLRFYRELLGHIRAYPFSFGRFLGEMPDWLRDRLTIPELLKRELGYGKETFFLKHHFSRAAGAFLVSPFEEAAILAVCDGEWATTSFGRGEGTDIRVIKEMRFPASLDLLCALAAAHLGFEPLRDAGKIAEMAGFGKPAYAGVFRRMTGLRSDGSLLVNPRICGTAFKELAGRSRDPWEPLEQRHYDLAASLQRFCEEAVVAMAHAVYRETKLERLCLAGDIFLNGALNNRILQDTPFKEVFIQPAASDSAGALGAAVYLYYFLSGKERKFTMWDACLGPEFPPSHYRRALAAQKIGFRELHDEELFPYVAGKIAQNKIVGWFQGRMEFGPRAFGNRSIVANPCAPGTKAMLNDKVKKKEPFAPYACAVLDARAADFFRVRQAPPCMLMAGPVRDDKANDMPAAAHIDKTALVQTVVKDINPRFWGLIKEFERITGIPVLINTSLNMPGEPMACSPEDAVSCFQRSRMDCLVLGNCVAER